MTLHDRILEYLIIIETTWPISCPGLSIEYYNDISHSLLYVTVRYDGFYVKRIFHVDERFYCDLDFDIITETIQEMRKEVMKKGKERRNMPLNGTRGSLYIDEFVYNRDIFDKKLMSKPEKIIFNDPATIILWDDGTKTIVKKNSKDKKFDPEKGIALCYMKKALGNKGNYNNVFKEWIK